MKLFNPESRFMEALSTISDLMILNLVTLVCCLPVITIGAALTGMHYVLLKMVRREEGYIVSMTADDPMTAVAIGTGQYIEYLGGR